MKNMNGSGYPDGLKVEEIPLNARIFAIIDVFDALVSKRPYKEPYSFDKAFKIIEDEKEKHFDGKIVDKFLFYKEIFENVFKKNDSVMIRKKLTQKRRGIFGV